MTSDNVNRIIVEILAVIIAVGVLAAIIVAIEQLPGMARYLRMHRIAKDHDGANPEKLPSPDSPQYAQSPRMATTHVPSVRHA